MEGKLEGIARIRKNIAHSEFLSEKMREFRPDSLIVNTRNAKVVNRKGTLLTKYFTINCIELGNW